METVHFRIHRKFAIQGGLVPYSLYVNGRFIGRIKNGETMNVDVPRADVYYLEAGPNIALEPNAVIREAALSDHSITIITRGGWKTPSYSEFYMEQVDGSVRIPAFHFERLLRAVWNDRMHELSEEERLLALCLEFSTGIQDDIQEVLSSEHFSGIMEALQKIGAEKYVQLLQQILREFFPGVSLPLNDEQIDRYRQSIEAANRRIWKNERAAWDELRCCMIGHITSKLCSSENLY